MAKQENLTIRVLVIDDRPEDAEALVSGLRNEGLPVRATRPASTDELLSCLTQQSFELVISQQNSTLVPFKLLVEEVHKTGKDLPVIMVLEKFEQESVSEAIRVGVDALALSWVPGNVLKVVQREFQLLTGRRDLRRLEASLRESERRCDALIDSSREPIAYVHEGMHIRANPAYLEMFGYEDFEDVEGMSILDMIAPSDSERFKKLLKGFSKGEVSTDDRQEVQARDAEGKNFAASMEFSHAEYEGEACLQIIFRRQELSADLAQEIDDLKRRDVATGLINRPTFLQSLEHAVSGAASNGDVHGLLQIQLDHYSQLLNQLGMDAADKFMRALGDRIRPLMTEKAELARLGESSLAILVRHAPHTETRALAESIVDVVRANIFKIEDQSITATASVAAVQIGERNAQVTRVLRRAEDLINTAVGLGGNRFEMFDPSEVDRAEEARIEAWVQRIRQAIDSNQLILHFQPIANLLGDPQPFYESYLRLLDVSGEAIAPGAFLAIAEERDMIREIDSIVIDRAAQTLAANVTEPLTRILAQISKSALSDPALADEVGAVISKYNLQPGQLLLLTHESSVSTQLVQAAELKTALDKIGSGLVIGQFGAGLNSFQLMAHLKPKFVKLDVSFMTDFAKSPEQQNKVRQLAEAAKAAGIPTIAPQVSDTASMTTLFTNSVEFVEGNFLSPPGPNLEFEF